MQGQVKAWGERIVPGLVAMLLCVVLLGLGALQPLEWAAYNGLYRIRGERAWDDRLVLVAIDDKSIDQLQRFPWPRQYYVELLERLAPAQPSVVAIDLVFSEATPADTALATALLQSGRVVLAQGRDGFGNLLLPVSPLREAAIATGHILHQPNEDGVTRSVQLMEGVYPSFGLAAVQTYSLTQAKVELPLFEVPYWLNWVGRSRSLPQYSFVDVIEQRVPPERFAQKLVLVGVTATGIDALRTPYDRNPPASGVHLQATLMNNLLQQRPLLPLSPGWVWLLVLVCGPGFGYGLSFCRNHWRCVVWLGASLGLGVGAVGLFYLGYWLPVVLAVGLMSTTMMATCWWEQWRRDRQLKQDVATLWRAYQGTIVAPEHTAPPAVAPTLPHDFGHSAQPTGDSITQLRELAAVFGRSQATQAAIAQSLAIGLVAVDLEGYIWFCNPAAQTWLAVAVGDRLPTALHPTWMTPQEWHSALATVMAQHGSAHQTVLRDDRWYTLTLEPLVYSVLLDPLASERSPLNGLLLVVEEITVQKQAELALADQVKELQRLSHLKDDFLSTVSHELRSPMTNIQMAIKLLEVTRSPDSTRHYLKILQAECTREIDLINDLLDLQRLEAGAHIFHPEAIALETWLPPLIEPFYERAESQQQSIKIELCEPLPVLAADTASLQRVLVELVNNACKYTPPDGTIKVTVNSSLDYVHLSVMNSGSEIPPAELPRIFEKFYRIPQADRWKRGGTGLGLALVQKLVHCLGGSIHVTSEAGFTTFTVQLPVVSESPLESPPPEAAGKSHYESKC